MVGLNLGVIQDYIDMGRFAKLSQRTSSSTDSSTDEGQPVVTLGVVDFIEAGIFKKTPGLAGIKLLAGGKERFTAQNVRLQVNRASDEAIAAAEQAGNNQVTTMHFNRLAMRALIRPDKFSKIGAPAAAAPVEAESEDSPLDQEDRYLLPKQARPPPKLQPYYTSWKNRGYLCPQVQMREFLDARPDLREAFEASLKIDDKEEATSASSRVKEE